ncbi:Acetyltransferase (GNAT) family protein [Nocardioides dokdonensis FR1436]|uniref:Acetyltransferase (GNAT) family protein n=1 Tax=Nocardioides dokdonensis FR1436 TaxID=1300347 RepID=A0A1A9GI82_9ACTN|nr:GNAT family N-acetyltransferase [Nocardioides dokdonensis]ANH37390.1 Acetyltransferase (GNAT) family protein [Nocardioides dokdonensis FR1436]
MSRLVLRPLRLDDEAVARLAHEELAGVFGFLIFAREGEPWAAYLDRIEGHRRGVGLDEGMVASTFLVAEVDGEVVGRASVRHELNAFLATWGGHIGYGVRPAYRRRGHATAMLRGCLEVCRDLGIEQALVTCDVDNVASAGVIEACGGVFEDVAPAGESVAAKKRYWVPTGL